MIAQTSVADHLVLERGEIARTLAVASPESTATRAVVPSSVSIQMIRAPAYIPTLGSRVLGVGPWELGVSLAVGSFVLIFVPMIAEAIVSARHDRALRALGAAEPSGDVYKMMQVAY